MTVLSQHSSTPTAPPLPSALRIIWRATHHTVDSARTPETSTIRITAVAKLDGSVIVETASEPEGNAIRAFTTTCRSTIHPDGGMVVSWETPTERLIRVALTNRGEVLAVRSAIPSAMGLPGGTYSRVLCQGEATDDTVGQPL